MNIITLTRRIEEMACGNMLFYKLSQFYYKKVVLKEIVLANIKAQDRVLVVGGGPCPYTGIIIHQLTKANVTIIDNDKKSVEQSKKFISRLGASGGINVLHMDGTKVDSRGYTVILIAVQAFPKDETLKAAEKTACVGTRVLVRLPKNRVRDLYFPFKGETFSKTAVTKHGVLGNVESTVLHIVKGELIEKTAV